MRWSRVKAVKLTITNIVVASGNQSGRGRNGTILANSTAPIPTSERKGTMV